MSGQKVVLVLTHRFDPTADYVVEELNRRGVPVFRCDPGEFPKRLTLVAILAGMAWSGRLRLPEREVALDDIGCAYFRRPTIFDLPDGMTDDVRRWAAHEARMGLGGVLSTLPRWLNHPRHITAAEYKPTQLTLALGCDLQVPRTIITNELATARAFAAEIGPVVYKPLTPASVIEGDTHRVVFTTRIEANQIDESVTSTAHLFQEWIDKAYEVRLTQVDDAVFATRIDGHSESASIDWRSDYDHLSYTPLPDVPGDVRAGVSRLLRRMRLRFGVLDFIVTPDDRWVFLEINPNGQWAWIEDATEQPITSAIADALLRKVPPR